MSLVEEEDEFTDSEIESAEDAVSDAASASQTIEELEAEIATLTDLEALAEEVRASGTDRKWRSSRAFCRTTRPCLTRAVVRIYGSMLRAERRKVEELFRQDKDVYVLIATDAAGEGLIMKSPNGYPGY